MSGYCAGVTVGAALGTFVRRFAWRPAAVCVCALSGGTG